MSGDSRLSARFGADTRDFKNGISEINREIKVLESGFRASASKLGDWSKSATGLESRITALNGKITLQKEKVDALTVAYEREVKAHGKNSIEAQNAIVTLNKENETLGKMQFELTNSTKVLDDMGKKASDAGKKTGGELKEGEDKAQKSTLNLNGALVVLKDGLKNVVAGVGALVADIAKLTIALSVGLLGAIVAVVTGGAAMILNTARTGDNIDEMAQKTGLSIQRLQELKYIADQNGTSIEDLAGMMAKVTRNMDAAGKAGSPAAKAFKELGVKTRDSKGELLDANQVFEDALDALSKIPNETERNALAMQIFGKNAAELGPMMDLGKDGMSRMTQEAHDMGAVMSDEDVKAAADLNDAITGLKDGIMGSVMTIAASFIPGLNGIVTLAQDFAQRLAKAVSIEDPEKQARAIGVVATSLVETVMGNILRELPKVFDTATGIIDAVIGGIQKMLPKMLPVVIQIMQTLIDFLVLEVPQLLGMGIQIISALANGLLTSLPQLLDLGMSVFDTLLTGILDALPGLVPMASSILQALLNNIMVMLPKLATAGMGILTTLVKFVTTNLPLLIPAVKQMITGLVGFIVENLPPMVDAAVQILMALVNGFLPMLPSLVIAAVQIIITLANGITQALPQLMPVIAEIIPQIVLALVGMLPVLVDAAGQLILALANGLVAAIPILLPYLPQILDAIVNALAASLPILGRAAVSIMNSLRDGIFNNIYLIGKVAGEIVDSFVKGVVVLVVQLGLVGAQIVTGLWDGIKKSWPNLLKSVLALIALLPASVRKFLQMSSPSKVFADIGENMALGLGVGFADQMKNVKKDINGALSGFQGGNLAFAGAGGGMYQRTNNVTNYYGPVTIQGEPGKAFEQKAGRF